MATPTTAVLISVEDVNIAENIAFNIGSYLIVKQGEVIDEVHYPEHKTKKVYDVPHGRAATFVLGSVENAYLKELQKQGINYEIVRLMFL
jgi:hypothetical protein